jgi:TolB-like protein/Tfp pilus assembly protein PilF
MPTDSESDLHLEIGHVLFVDIVGYTKLLIDDQRERLQALNEIVRNTAQFRVSDANGRLVRIPTGDGMALIFRDNVEAPLRCAVEISQAVKTHPEIHLRMGIHSGSVSEVADVNERTNIAGAGIDIAQRVMDCGDAGHILLSKHIAEDLAPHRRWNRYLHDLGECEVKHGNRLSVVNFYNDEVGNPEVPEKFKRGKLRLAKGMISSGAPRTVRPMQIGVWLAAAFILIAAFWLFSHRLPVRSPSAPVPPIAVKPVSEKSIAVLPFENLSGDPNNAYFTEGIQEEILTRLAKIADLKVISRTSTRHFKSSPNNLPEIAQQLGVANILEGGVQKAGDSVRVNVQLIKAATDTHLWAESFDRQLTDIFRIESEIAKAIADTLQAKLSGAEQSAIATRPTENSEAHDLYLKGRYFLAKRSSDGFKSAIDYFNQAIAKDPNYALAYAGLADSYALLPEWSKEPVAGVLPKARAAAEKALSIDNGLAEAHVALGLVLWADLNLKEAKREFERAIELNPNYADAHYFLARTVLAPLGQFGQAIAELKRAVELDPFSVIMNANLGRCYLWARRYPEAIAQLRKTVELDTTFPPAHGMLGAALLLSGNSAGAIREYEKSYEVEKASEFVVVHAVPLMLLAHAYALQGEREKALQFLGQVQDIERRTGGVGPYRYAMIYMALGDKNKAIDSLERSYQAKENLIIDIKVDPFLDGLHGDPRFEKLANQVVPPDSH